MSAKSINISIAQVNVLVGDIEGNSQLIIDTYKGVVETQQPDVVVFPELVLTGYPPEDLLLRDDLYPRLDLAVANILEHVESTALIIGLAEKTDDGIFNVAYVCQNRKIISKARKQFLPNYSVFDEKRYFKAGETSCVFELNEVKLGVLICEDIWYQEPAASAKAQGAELLININASPYHIDRIKQRHETVGARVKETGLPVVYANLVGGQDELVFDGESFVMTGDGNVAAALSAFKVATECTKLAWSESGWSVVNPGPMPSSLSQIELVYRALVLGVRDYIHKNGFAGAVIGLSGGIDSAVTLAIAVDAVGAENVEAVLMPSQYTAQMSIDDAIEEAEILGVPHHIISIESTFAAFTESLRELFKGLPEDTTEENIQARCRGVILMAVSNKTRKMVLTTGNKSEMAVGYATLYGDMAGGYAVLKDVIKTRVYELARYRNSIASDKGYVIPERVITRPPSAELKPDQKDSDSLPDYDILDAILVRYVELDESPAEIIAAGYDQKVVNRIIRMIDRNEYKRRQAAPGVRITARAFSRDRRYPITSGYGKSL